MNCRAPLQICLVMAAVISLSDCRGNWGSSWLRRLTSGYDKRVTVFDRMGRYYGKRTSPELDDEFKSKIRPLYTVDDMKELISSSPRFLTGIIGGFIDQNGDGFVDEDEMAELREKIMEL